MRDAIVFQSFQRFYVCGQGLITYNLKNNEKNKRANATAYKLRLAIESTQVK